jgi:lipopolysaccharide cholinephosphotransferase
MEEGYNNIIPSYVFFDCIDIDFEGRKYKAVSDYDTYLKSIFGDYMKLPPAEEQVTHHLYDSFIL